MMCCRRRQLPIPDHCRFSNLCSMRCTRRAASAGSSPLLRIVRLAASKGRSRAAPMKSSTRSRPTSRRHCRRCCAPSPRCVRAMKRLRHVRSYSPKSQARRHDLALVDALIAARLLVSDEDAAGHVFVRVAHEALLSRWPRASDIVNANRSFLETRARLKADAHRWHSDNKNRELLLPSGKRLAEGEELLLSRREEVDDEVVEYIEASLRAQKEREEKDRQAERALIEAAEAAKRERLEREAERRGSS